VLDDLPEVIPVTGPELDVIETYLGNLIDQFLLDAASDASTSLGSPPRSRLVTPCARLTAQTKNPASVTPARSWQQHQHGP
jgi:hypothetical protein